MNRIFKNIGDEIDEKYIYPIGWAMDGGVALCDHKRRVLNRCSSERYGKNIIIDTYEEADDGDLVWVPKYVHIPGETDYGTNLTLCRVKDNKSGACECERCCMASDKEDLCMNAGWPCIYGSRKVYFEEITEDEHIGLNDVDFTRYISKRATCALVTKRKREGHMSKPINKIFE